jgi:hypothetical protein
MEVQSELIQPGWTVFASDGEEVGTVSSFEGHTLAIRKSGLLGSKEFHVPQSAVRDVETGRVELSMTKEEVEQSKS